MIVLENEEIRVILNEHGATIESIYNKTNKTEHYWTYDRNIWPRRTSICFPICGGLIDDEYFLEKKRYSMPMHGFLREKKCEIHDLSPQRAILGMSDSYETRQIYPFHFKLLLEHYVNSNSLEIKYSVENTGDSPLLFSIGSHYTYSLPKSQSDCVYFFSKPQKANSYTQKNGIIGKQEETSVFSGYVLSMDHLFDVSSKIYKAADIDSDYIAIGNGQEIFTKVQYSGFKYIVLWAPKGNNSPFACIEPWAGMADFQWHNKNFKEKDGIISLEAGKIKSFTQTITVY